MRHPRSRWFCGLLSLLLLFSCVPCPAGAAAADDTFKVVAYYPSWRPDSQQSKLRFDILTHVNYAFAIPTSDGSLKPLENPSGAKKLIAGAHANGVKVLLSVGGWSDGDTLLDPVFASATGTAAKRTQLVNAILNMCAEYGFDGVDLDWEYPRTSGTYRQYEQLVAELSRRLKAQGKLLTAAVIGGTSVQGTPYSESMAFTDTALADLDWINVMAYDGDEGSGHSTYSFAVSCGRYWRDTRGVPAEKVVLGMPFYGRPGSVMYSAILKSDGSAAEKDTIWYQGKQIWYNGADTIAAKTGFALDELGGVMIWEITQDAAGTTDSLLSVIGETIGGSGFVDVPRTAWYAGDVKTARELGLVNGVGQGRYAPGGTVTWIDAVTLAARIHRIYTAGRDDLVQGSPWYHVYVDYALRSGMLDRAPAAEQANEPITRAQFAVLLAKSLPAYALPAVNRVGNIPDVPQSSSCAPVIYQLYRAGIFSGVDGRGAFRPDASLTRAEVAALCVRMLEPGQRKSFTLN